jgi:hypothetical protein
MSTLQYIIYYSEIKYLFFEGCMLCPLLSSPLGQEYKEDLALSSDLFSKWPLLEDPYEKHFVQVKTHDVPTNP